MHTVTCVLAEQRLQASNCYFFVLAELCCKCVPRRLPSFCAAAQRVTDARCIVQGGLLEERDLGVLMAVVTLLLGIVSRNYEGALQ